MAKRKATNEHEADKTDSANVDGPIFDKNDIIRVTLPDKSETVILVTGDAWEAMMNHMVSGSAYKVQYIGRLVFGEWHE